MHAERLTTIKESYDFAKEAHGIRVRFRHATPPLADQEVAAGVGDLTGKGIAS